MNDGTSRRTQPAASSEQQRLPSVSCNQQTFDLNYGVNSKQDENNKKKIAKEQKIENKISTERQRNEGAASSSKLAELACRHELHVGAAGLRHGFECESQKLKEHRAMTAHLTRHRNALCKMSIMMTATHIHIICKAAHTHTHTHKCHMYIALLRDCGGQCGKSLYNGIMCWYAEIIIKVRIY